MVNVSTWILQSGVEKIWAAKNRPKRLKFDTLQGVVKVNYTSAMDPIASYTKIKDWFIVT